MFLRCYLVSLEMKAELLAIAFPQVRAKEMSVCVSLALWKTSLKPFRSLGLGKIASFCEILKKQHSVKGQQVLYLMNLNYNCGAFKRAIRRSYPTGLSPFMRFIPFMKHQEKKRMISRTELAKHPFKMFLF